MERSDRNWRERGVQSWNEQPSLGDVSIYGANQNRAFLWAQCQGARPKRHLREREGPCFRPPPSQTYCGWLKSKSILHHFEATVETIVCWCVWCKLDFVHPQYAGCRKTVWRLEQQGPPSKMTMNILDKGEASRGMLRWQVMIFPSQPFGTPDTKKCPSQ